MNNLQIYKLTKNNDYALLLSYLRSLNESFEPHLSSIVDIEDYARKLIDNAHVAILKKGEVFAGLLAIYVNDPEKDEAYITLIAVLNEYKGVGYADILIREAKSITQQKGFHSIKLEVNSTNQRAIKFYQKYGFVEVEAHKQDSKHMIFHL